MQKLKKTKSNSGSALLLTTILLFVILGMVVSLTYVTVMEQKMSSKTKSSVGSFYSAESGIEWALDKIANTTGANPVIADAFPNFSSGKTSCPADFNCEVWLLDQNGKVITNSAAYLSNVKAVRSVGTNQNETQRAIEAAVAATNPACFTYYCGGSSAENNCTDSGLPQGYCPAGWTQKIALGHWGVCHDPGSSSYVFFRPPGGGCQSSWVYVNIGEAYLCCQ